MIGRMKEHAAEVRQLRAALRESDARWERTLEYVRAALFCATRSTPHDAREEVALGRLWLNMEAEGKTALTATRALDQHPMATCVMTFWYQDVNDFRCLVVVMTESVRHAVSRFRGRTLDELLVKLRKAGLKPGRRPPVLGYASPPGRAPPR